MASITNKGQGEKVDTYIEVEDISTDIIKFFGSCLCGIANVKMNPDTLKMDMDTMRYYRCPVHSLHTKQGQVLK